MQLVILEFHPDEMSVGDTIEELALIIEAGVPSDYEDRIEYMPVT